MTSDVGQQKNKTLDNVNGVLSGDNPLSKMSHLNEAKRLLTPEDYKAIHMKEIGLIKDQLSQHAESTKQSRLSST